MKTLVTKVLLLGEYAVSRGGKTPRNEIYLVLVKRDVLRYAYNLKMVRELEQDISEHSSVLRKIKLVGTCIKRTEVNRMGRMIRSERFSV